MIEVKAKPCRGINKAHGFGGCGVPTLHREYGLGKMCGCYSKWLMETEAGQLKIAKSILKVQKPRLSLETAEREEKERNSLKAALINTKQVVHTFVRERDKYKPCVSCDKPWEPEFEAGHHYSANSYLTLKYDLDNINGQCVYCNQHLESNFDNYALRLPSRIGKERYDILVSKARIDKQFTKVWNVENLKAIRDNIKSLKQTA